MFNLVKHFDCRLILLIPNSCHGLKPHHCNRYSSIWTDRFWKHFPSNCCRGILSIAESLITPTREYKRRGGTYRTPAHWDFSHTALTQLKAQGQAVKCWRTSYVAHTVADLFICFFVRHRLKTVKVARLFITIETESLQTSSNHCTLNLARLLKFLIPSGEDDCLLLTAAIENSRSSIWSQKFSTLEGDQLSASFGHWSDSIYNQVAKLFPSTHSGLITHKEW